MSEKTEASQDAANKPVPTVICIGMAGSGKTTFMQRLNSHLHAKKQTPYVINLDPAVLKVPFGTNIDIRDSVDYKKVQENYNLGPNGAIMTSLNLFSTKIDQVLQIIEKRASQVDKVIIDTPGQIECFIWSASGAIITDALASSFPTVIAYIIDTPRTASPATFMSNMLYACSILYKTKLPMIIVFNKTDIKDASFAKEWMTDFEAFQAALAGDDELNGEGENTSGYMGSLVNSMSLMLEEFYNHLDVVGVSAFTGAGFDEFLAAVDNKVEEYNKDYKSERDRILKKREEDAAKKKTKNLVRLMEDIGINGGKGKANEDQVDVLSDLEDEENDDDYAGVMDPDNEFRGNRENLFVDEQEDRNTESLQDRYQAALKGARSEEEARQIEDFVKKNLK